MSGLTKTTFEITGNLECSRWQPRYIYENLWNQYW